MTEVSAGTLTDFLLARIAEDVVDIDARNMTCGCAVEGFPMLHGVTCPAKLRADYEAKRRIVELHQDSRPDEGPHQCATCDAQGSPLDEWPCPTLLALAIPYADHEHFRPEWRI